jgi:hypothetical protein
MSIGTTLNYASVEDLYFDPKNPRLGRRNIERGLSQQEILDLLSTWTIDELALSYLENGGFWTHEALLVVEEELAGAPHLVVVEGNRRLAALKCLLLAFQGTPTSRKWATLVEGVQPQPDLFKRVPYLLVGSRDDVAAFLGFRHVTGIKQWDADEKAGFIAQLIDKDDLSYEQVMRRIGSKTPTVRHHYIAYRLLLQIEDSVETFEPEFAEQRFAILYMTIQTTGAQRYLQIDITAEPLMAKRPVPQARLAQLAHFAQWLFGTESLDALVTDTRQVSEFGTLLESELAVEYLEKTSHPKFDVALRIAGGDESEIIRNVEDAANSLELALSRAHLFKTSAELQKAVKTVGAHALQLLAIFPTIKQELMENS